MSFLFGSKVQRAFKKIQDLASNDMVDQAAVMVEEELDLLLSDNDISAKLVPFLMDIGHPDLGGRIGEKIIRTHPKLKGSISRLLEEKQVQFPRSIELFKVVWRSRLQQRDFTGLMELLKRTEKITVKRFSDSVKIAFQAVEAVTGRELGSSIDRVLAWAVIILQNGDPEEAMDVLVGAAERCRFPEESLARLSGWIGTSTGGINMEVNLKRVIILAAIGDTERAISELPSLYDAETDVLNRAIAVVEKDLLPSDKTVQARISLSRLIRESGRVNDACYILEDLIDENRDLALLEKAVTNIVLNASSNARVHLLQAKLRLVRGENTQALDSVDRAFQCTDVADSPVVDICRKFIDSGVDREGLVVNKLGEFLVEKGSIEEAVNVLVLAAQQSPEWVLEQIQKLLKRDRTSAAVLTLLAVVLLIDKRGGEAAATLKHLSARGDVKSRQDIVSVLSHFENLMGTHHELRRLRAASASETGDGGAAVDWLELLIAGEDMDDSGLLEIFDRDILRDRASEVIASGFTPESSAGKLVFGAAKIFSGNTGNSVKHLTEALADISLLDRVTNLVASLPFSTIFAMKPAELFLALNRNNKGTVVEKLLPLMASSGAEDWMDNLASQLVLKSEIDTLTFRLNYFIERGMLGTAASSVQGLDIKEEDFSQLINGCSAAVAGKIDQATEYLLQAAASSRTAYLARDVLAGFQKTGKSSPTTAIALAKAQMNTDDNAGAVNTLKPFLDQTTVLEYLETAVVRIPEFSEIHSSLALARLFAHDMDGFCMAAGTAVEGSSELAEQLIKPGIEYSLEHSNASGLLFAAELGIKHIQDYDPSSILIKALCLQPDLHERIGRIPTGNTQLKMLILLASCNAGDFVFIPLPGEVVTPIDMIENAQLAWKNSSSVKALKQLELLSDHSGYGALSHKIRISMAGLGEDCSEALLNDAKEDSSYRVDFMEQCSNQQFAVLAIDQFFPHGPGSADKSEIIIAVDMLVRCKSTNKLFELAHEILKNGSPENQEIAGRIVDVFIPTADEDGYLSVSQIIDLLLVAGRTFDAFFFARGDSEFLSRVRDMVARRDSISDSVSALLREGKYAEAYKSTDASSSKLLRGEALWCMGKRIAACSVWREAYSTTEDPCFLQRLEYALKWMGYSDEVDAVERLLSEKHPEYILPPDRVVLPCNSMQMIVCDIK